MTITLFLLLFEPLLSADVRQPNCPSVNWLSPNQVSFVYFPASAIDKPWFYAKAFDVTESQANNLDQTESNGRDLVYLPETDPPIYEVPPNSHKLVIFIATEKLQQFNDKSLIDPVINKTDSLQIWLQTHHKRNANNIPQPLPKETHTVSMNDIHICELKIKVHI